MTMYSEICKLVLISIQSQKSKQKTSWHIYSCICVLIFCYNLDYIYRQTKKFNIVFKFVML